MYLYILNQFLIRDLYNGTHFLMIKPDAVQRNLIGEIISRIERKGLKIVGGKFIIPTKDTVNIHYAEHTEKPFFHKLVSFLTSDLCLPWLLKEKTQLRYLDILSENKSH